MPGTRPAMSVFSERKHSFTLPLPLTDTGEPLSARAARVYVHAVEREHGL